MQPPARTRFALSMFCLIGLTIFTIASAQAQTFKILHDFTGGMDGRYPSAGLTRDQAGNFYGTTCEGGSTNNGVVYRIVIKPSGPIFSTLYSFAGSTDGSCPESRVVFGPDGALYGTTNNGGSEGACSAGCGTVFKLQPPIHACASVNCNWLETVLYRFQGGTDGKYPGLSDLVFDPAGNLYGTALAAGQGSCYDQGPGCGVVFKLVPSHGSWTQTVLYSFAGGTDGAFPNSGVTLDQAGNLYGTTATGGADQLGVVYELSANGSGWTETVLHNFSGTISDGAVGAGVIFDAFGNLYGATLKGGSGNAGVVYQLTSSNGSWSYQTLYSFTFNLQAGGATDRLTLDGAGNLYGTTTFDPQGGGGVFKLANGSWAETDLYDFDYSCDTGCSPDGSVIFDEAGNIYGTTQVHGPGNSFGTVFEITP